LKLTNQADVKDTDSDEDAGDEEELPKSKKGKKKTAEDFTYRDAFEYRIGINETFAPISDIQQIFDDMTSKARELGLDQALEHLNGRELRLATMCSGTESPLLAMQLAAIGEFGILTLFAQ
jgi:hypothetical protein